VLALFIVAVLYNAAPWRLHAAGGWHNEPSLSADDHDIIDPHAERAEDVGPVRCTSDSFGAVSAASNHCAWWQAIHNATVAIVQEHSFDVMFYGDSLTEMWHGTRGGKPFAAREALPGVFDQHIGSKWHTAAFGMSGDTALNLEWRLQHGELPGLDRAPRVVVVLCGTNDLRDAKVMRDSTKALREAATAAEAILSAAPAVVASLERIVRLIRKQLPETKIVVMDLLPRHKSGKSPPLLWDQTNPYYEGVRKVNQLLSEFTAASDDIYPLDCGRVFMANNEQQLHAELLPDALHPSALGAMPLAECIAGGVDRALQDT